MVTKNQIKLIKSLHQKKYRKEHGLFIAEGIKVIQELLKADFTLENLYMTQDLDLKAPDQKKVLIKKAEMEKISALTSASDVLAVFHCPKPQAVDYKDLVVALDDVRDPGNLGTIIRLCDWFGIKHIICSAQSVDAFNPKVIQATMGSIARVNLVYGDLQQMILDNGENKSVYGTFMDAKNIYKSDLAIDGIVVFGNEANGISKQIEQLVTNKISIPRFGDLQQTESLNVAMATSIVLSEFRRNNS
ncbi:TrmH family RNA methyltransferase [Myroides sp. LJL110]